MSENHFNKLVMLPRLFIANKLDLVIQPEWRTFEYLYLTNEK
jgi:hypothetical protein